MRAMAAQVRAEGGGGDYGTASGGYDQLGFGTLLFTRDRVAAASTRTPSASPSPSPATSRRSVGRPSASVSLGDAVDAGTVPASTGSAAAAPPDLVLTGQRSRLGGGIETIASGAAVAAALGGTLLLRRRNRRNPTQ